MASSSTRSPFLTRPSATATDSARGIDAAEVLPCRSTVKTTFCGAICSLCAEASMIRLLAWCGTNQSISSAEVPVALKASTITSVIMPTACLKTSRPSIRRYPTVRVEDTPPSTYNFDLCRPSERRCVVNMPRSAVVPVENPRESLGADHQRALERAAAQEIVGGGEREDEPGAYRLQVEGSPMVDAEIVLHRNRGRRKGVVGRRGRQHDQVDRLRVDPGIGERRARGVNGEVRGELAFGGDM